MSKPTDERYTPQDVLDVVRSFAPIVDRFETREALFLCCNELISQDLRQRKTIELACAQPDRD